VTVAVPRAIVACHGDLAAGLVSAVEAITGRGDRFVPIGNAGRSRDALEAALREAVAAHDARCIFTDLPAGSPTLAARRIQRDLPHLVVVTGTNLPALLEFAMHDGGDADVAAARGREALAVHGGTDAV
jgi:PTS system N-acetylgalactosamine-specific IIA component